MEAREQKLAASVQESRQFSQLSDLHPCSSFTGRLFRGDLRYVWLSRTDRRDGVSPGVLAPYNVPDSLFRVGFVM